MSMLFDGAGVLPYVVTEDSKIKVLLGKRAVKREYGKWSVFGGKKEPGETYVAAAARELREEAGIAASHGELVPLYKACVPFLFEYDIFSLDLKSIDVKVSLNWETSEYRWFDIDEAISLGDQLASYAQAELIELKKKRLCPKAD